MNVLGERNTHGRGTIAQCTCVSLHQARNFDDFWHRSRYLKRLDYNVSEYHACHRKSSLSYSETSLQNQFAQLQVFTEISLKEWGILEGNPTSRARASSICSRPFLSRPFTWLAAIEIARIIRRRGRKDASYLQHQLC